MKVIQNFWKKEHQIKIFANEFKTIGFNFIHKKEGLDEMVQLLESTYMRQHGKPASIEYGELVLKD